MSWKLGERFGSLVVTGTTKRGRYKMLKLLCDCGNEHAATRSNLNKGTLNSCGCKMIEGRRRARTHGHASSVKGRTKEYRVWAHIKDRCYNPKTKEFKNYGGRGIIVHKEWLDSYETFLRGVGPSPSPQHTLDRVDNDKGYEPGNVRWATKAEQSRNTRRTIKIDGKCLKDYCAERELNYDAVQTRIRRGNPLKAALSPLMGHAYRSVLAQLKGEKP
jgi:hypothetical protein